MKTFRDDLAWQVQEELVETRDLRLCEALARPGGLRGPRRLYAAWRRFQGVACTLAIALAGARRDPRPGAPGLGAGEDSPQEESRGEGRVAGADLELQRVLGRAVTSSVSVIESSRCLGRVDR